MDTKVELKTVCYICKSVECYKGCIEEASKIYTLLVDEYDVDKEFLRSSTGIELIKLLVVLLDMNMEYTRKALMEVFSGVRMYGKL